MPRNSPTKPFPPKPAPPLTADEHLDLAFDHLKAAGYGEWAAAIRESDSTPGLTDALANCVRTLDAIARTESDRNDYARMNRAARAAAAVQALAQEL